ncbi:MAG: hypothetical protein AB1349_02355 [Elusimicrobiota bacterium]
MIIFEVKSITGKTIRLTAIQWVHIRKRHPEMDNQLSKLTITIQQPDLIYYCPEEDNVHYYKHFKETPVSEKYLLLIAQHTNGDGFVITAFFVKKIRKEKKEVVYGEKNLNKLR